MPLPSPIYLIVTQCGRDRSIETPDIDMTRDGLVADIAAGQINPPAYIFEWFTDEPCAPRDVTGDLAYEVREQLYQRGRGVKGDLRDWIDEHCGASEADKINAHAGVLEPA